MMRTLFAALCAAMIAAPVAAQDTPRPVSASEMLAEARAMAGGDPRLLDEIEAAQAQASKGVLGSDTAVAVRQTIPGGASWSVPVARRSGQPLVVAVRRVGEGPVTLRVLDGEGKQLCADVTGSPLLSCRIAPGNGLLSVKVNNPGATPTEAMVLTN